MFDNYYEEIVNKFTCLSASEILANIDDYMIVFCTLIIVERGCCSKEAQVPLTPMLQLVHGARVATGGHSAATPEEATAITDSGKRGV